MRNPFAEYIAETPELMAFFARSPKALFTSAAKVAPWRPDLAETLRVYQEQLGGRALFMGDEALVVTGQQPGLFTGPLYAVYKAATAVLLAQKLQARFGVPHVPVFWVAGDDHDFEEARTAHFLGKDYEPFSLRYEPVQPVQGLPMYRVPLTSELHGFIDRAAAETAGSEFRDEIAAFLHESLDSAASLADWTARLVARLFNGTPLVVFSPHLPQARALAAAVLEREIAAPLATTRLLNEAGAALFALDFPHQVEKAENECNFFVEVDGNRCKVLFEENGYLLPEKGLRYSIDEMQTLLNESPDRFSPNVALRCIVQQHLFPAAAYVAGPGEVAYWAQLKPMFEHFGLEMPAVYPRARCTLTNAKVNKLMDRLGFVRQDLDAPREELVKRALEAANRGPALEIAQRGRAPIHAAVEALTEELGPHNKTAAAMSKKLERKVASELDRIERMILQGDEAQTEAIRKQVARVCNTIAPWRKPQERVYTVFSFLFEQGWGLIPRLLRELDIASFAMNEVEL